MKRFFLSSIPVMFSLCANAQVGIGTLNPRAGLHAADSSVVFHAPGDATAGLPASPVIGEGRRMMWYADKAAFRAGYVGSDDNYWDEINIGKYSFAGGYNTRGPMAQDFNAAFGLDGVSNDTTINTVNIDGVNMAAIQALEKRTRELQAEMVGSGRAFTK
ncbi:hypothetical protein SAMN04487996_14014 [Dyadobacter soli]|uniref:Uncharacterized protein n=1 Tax=Dyadobacter soli TaxID=659014 RepID=A0A1G8CUX1_9BACT|nr:hypothetical protein [Dyadobacter soli]SDH49302.1 hypothetical protein SAMN04487996_14014 [Dyadobacter soli]